MIADTEYLQDILNVYSTLTNLQITITDKVGNRITKQKDNPNIFDLISGKDQSKTLFGNIIQNYPKITGPILYEVLPEIKILVCPIYLENEVEFFIFAGGILEYPSKQSLQLYLNSYLSNPEKVSLILSLLEEFTINEIQEKMQKIKKMSEVILNGLQIYKKNNDINIKNIKQDELFKLVANDNIGIFDLVQRFYEKNPRVAFVGYAKRISPVHFEIKEFLPLGNQFIGTSFLMGKEMLEQAIGMNSGRFWENIELDPRMGFFHKRGIFPKSIFCFPIIREQDILGLFFGGSSEFGNLEKEVSFEGNLTASMINHIENKMYWKEQAIFNQKRSDLLTNIFQSISSFNDFKCVQDFLLDYSIKLVYTKFALVAFLEKPTKSINIVSNGLTEEKINQYKDRYLQEMNFDPSEINPRNQGTRWGDLVLEIPILHLNNLYGWLCIGLIDDVEDNHFSLLNLLANAAGVAFHLLSIRGNSEINGTTVDSLVKLMDFNDLDLLERTRKLTDDINLTKREVEVLKLVLKGKSNREIARNLYISGHTVKNHMTNIFQKLSVNDRAQVIAKVYQMGYKP